MKFKVTGMMCSACKAHVTKAVKNLKGAKHVEVDLEQGTLSVDYKGDASEVIAAVTDEGYGAEIING